MGSVSVESEGSQLTVKVFDAMPLRAVLEALCERTETDCKLPKTTPDKLVQARTVHGSWFEVVGELLQGSDLRFAVTPPVFGRKAVLVIEPAAAPSTADGPATVPVTGTPGADAEASTEAEIAPEEPAVEAQPESSAAAQGSPSDAPLVTAATAAATPGVSFAMTPFSDGQGSPLMARVGSGQAGAGGASPNATPGMAILPFSDEIGNPMVVPITNEPLSLTPFSGPDGEAWPAPVVQPGQPPLQFPMTPNAPASNPNPDKP